MGATVLENRMGSVRINITPTSVTSFTTSNQSFQVSGLNATTDQILNVTPSSFNAGLSLEASVTSNNNVTIYFSNGSAAPITPHVGNYVLTWFRPEGGPRSTVVGT